MIAIDVMTHDELVRHLKTQGTLTDIETALLDRLITALDEVDQLTYELQHAQRHKE